MDTNASILGQVESLRGTLAGLHGELTAFEAQRRSRSEVDTLVSQQVAYWQAQASAQVSVDLRRMASGQQVRLLEIRAINGFVDLGPWIATAMGEKRLLAWLKSLSSELPEGLDGAQRTERIHDIGLEIDMVAAAEEALLREADDLGSPIDPRPDADPRAALVLGFGE